MITTENKNRGFRFVKETPSLGSEDVAQQKQRLRAYMKKRRAENENRDVKEQALIDNFYRFLVNEIFKTTIPCMRRSFFVYLSRSSEAVTDKLIEKLLCEGHIVCCPRVVNEQTKEMEAVMYGDDFSWDARGVREPIGQAYTGGIDVAIIPFLAVDREGNRLGYGGGYYDRFLEKNPHTLRVAFGYDFQIVQSVPTEMTDVKMDAIVTDKQTFWISDKKR